MKVAGITESGDWIFGRNKASYKKDSAAIKQNVVTRLRSFKNDWFLDTENGIDWLAILGSLNNRQQLLDAITNVVLNTEGVRRLDDIEILPESKRDVSIIIIYTDIFNLKFIIKESIQE